jgi:hypothetical protein
MTKNEVTWLEWVCSQVRGRGKTIPVTGKHVAWMQVI